MPGTKDSHCSWMIMVIQDKVAMVFIILKMAIMMTVIIKR